MTAICTCPPAKNEWVNNPITGKKLQQRVLVPNPDCPKHGALTRPEPAEAQVDPAAAQAARQAFRRAPMSATQRRFGANGLMPGGQPGPLMEAFKRHGR